jgi:hypothetical protein
MVVHSWAMFGRRRTKSPESAGPSIEPLNENEIHWRNSSLDAAAIFAERYAGSRDKPPSLMDLDQCVRAWLADDEARPDINAFVNAVGVAFGAHVARDAGLTWVIATDEHGSDLALHGEHGNVVIYPANAVAKRISTGTTDFLVELHRSMVSGVEERRTQEP